MSNQLKSVLIASAIAVAYVASAGAAEMNQVGTIALPGAPINQFGSMAINQTTGLGYLADKDNSGVAVFDTKTDQFRFARYRLCRNGQERQCLGSEWYCGRQRRLRNMGERWRQHDQGH